MPQHVAHRSCDILWQCLKVGCPSSTLRQIATWHHFHWSDVLVNPAGMASWWSHLSRTSCCLMLEVTFLSRHNKTSECKVMTPICAFHQIHVSPRRSTCSHGLVPSCSSLQQNFQDQSPNITDLVRLAVHPDVGTENVGQRHFLPCCHSSPSPGTAATGAPESCCFDGFHTADGRSW